MMNNLDPIGISIFGPAYNAGSPFFDDIAALKPNTYSCLFLSHDAFAQRLALSSIGKHPISDEAFRIGTVLFIKKDPGIDAFTLDDFFALARTVRGLRQEALSDQISKMANNKAYIAKIYRALVHPLHAVDRSIAGEIARTPRSTPISKTLAPYEMVTEIRLFFNAMMGNPQAMNESPDYLLNEIKGLNHFLCRQVQWFLEESALVLDNRTPKSVALATVLATAAPKDALHLMYSDPLFDFYIQRIGDNRSSATGSLHLTEISLLQTMLKVALRQLSPPSNMPLLSRDNVVPIRAGLITPPARFITANND